MSTVRATSQRIIQFQLLDGTTPINLTGLSYIELRLTLEGVIKSFKTTDSTPLLFVTDATLGKLELRPATNTFTAMGDWKGFFWLVETSGKIQAVPEKEDAVVSIYPKF